MNLYDELELTPNCSFEDIKQQYRTLAGIHHPDKGGDEEKFKKIKLAYEVLSDPIRRKQYDENKTIDTAKDIHHEAINALADMFFSIVPNFDCKNANLLERLKTEASNTKNRLVHDLSINEQYIENIEVMKQKIKIKNPNDEDVLLSFVNKQLEFRHNDKKNLTHRLELIDEILKILENYEYGFFEIPNQQITSL